MYEINQSLDASGITGATPIPVGINENCTFKGMEVKKDKNGNSYMSFKFVDSNGNELNHNEFDVNPQYVTPKEGESKEDAVLRRVNNMLIRVKHICTTFMPKDQFNVRGNDFVELCQNIAQVMSNVNTQATPVRLKVVYDYKDYNAVPNYAPFIEPMSVANTSLRITQYDKLQKTAATATTEVQQTDDVDLPF
jgi:hypothetical protein